MKWPLVAAIGAALELSGCASVRLPLCPDLAKTTYRQGEPKTLYGKYVELNASALSVNLRTLSPFVMRASGTVWHLHQFKHDYSFEVCAFSAGKVTVPRETYLRCMDHVRKWIAIVNSPEPADLMLREYEYEPVCASGAK